MVFNWWMLGTALLYVCTLTSNAWRPYEMKLTNFTFYPENENFTVNATIKDSVFNALVDSKETVQQLFMHVGVFLDLGNGKYDLEFMNRMIDVCRLLRDRRYEPFVQVAYKSVLPYCNCPSRCPISKIYYVKAPQSNHAGLQYPTANALKIAYVPAPQPQHSLTFATAPTNSKVAIAPQPHYQNYQLAYAHQQPISYAAAAIAVPYNNNNNNHHQQQQQIIQLPNGYQLAAFSHQPVQISQPYSYVTSTPSEAGKAIAHGPHATQTNNAYHQQQQSFTFPTYQHLPGPINVPTNSKFVAYPTYSSSQYKTINAPAQPLATAATHSAHDGATSFASFSQQLNQRYHTTPTAITPVKVLAQPQQYYVTAPPPSAPAGYSSQKIAFQPITAASSSPQAYESPHNVNGIIHYGTHLYHPALGKYAIGQVAPSPKLIYSH